MHTLNIYMLESKAPGKYNTGAYMSINTAWSETGSLQQCDCVSMTEIHEMPMP